MSNRRRSKPPAKAARRPLKKRPARELASSLHEKIQEGVERTIHLVGLVPDDRMDWRPAASAASSPNVVDLGHLLGHLLDCVAGFCAGLQAAFPSARREFKQIRELEVNHSCRPDDAAARLHQYSRCISKAFEFCSDEDLARKIPTVFASEGEPLITLLLGNLEHLTNHKYQLFFYLRLLGVPVNTGDLYRLRSVFESAPLAKAIDIQKSS